MKKLLLISIMAVFAYACSQKEDLSEFKTGYSHDEVMQIAKDQFNTYNYDNGKKINLLGGLLILEGIKGTYQGTDTLATGDTARRCKGSTGDCAVTLSINVIENRKIIKKNLVIFFEQNSYSTFIADSYSLIHDNLGTLVSLVNEVEVQ